MNSAKRIKTVVMIASLAGILWLIAGYFIFDSGMDSLMGGCIIKRVTGYPCPSCGITRALILILTGQPSGALLLNPMSYIVGTFMIVTPVWIIFDRIAGKESFYYTYHKVEQYLRKRYVAFSLIGLVFINWIWNIYKGL